MHFIRQENPVFSLGYPIEDNGLQYTAAGWVIFNKMETTWCITWIREERERKKEQTCLFRLIHRRTRRDITSVTVFRSPTSVWTFAKPLTANIRERAWVTRRRFIIVWILASLLSSGGRCLLWRGVQFLPCAPLFCPKNEREKRKILVAEWANKLARVQGVLIVWKMSCLAQEDCVARNYTPTTDNTADASANTDTVSVPLFVFLKNGPISDKHTHSYPHQSQYSTIYNALQKVFGFFSRIFDLLALIR